MSERQRAHWLHLPDEMRLNQACVNLGKAWATPYLVGSAMQRPDWRDVDVRIILPDADFEAMFNVPADADPMPLRLRWSIICSLISRQLTEATGLPVDFQFQSQTQANQYGGPRNPLGFFPRFGDELDAEHAGGGDGR